MYTSKYYYNKIKKILTKKNISPQEVKELLRNITFYYYKDPTNHLFQRDYFADHIHQYSFDIKDMSKNYVLEGITKKISFINKIIYKFFNKPLPKTQSIKKQEIHFKFKCNDHSFKIKQYETSTIEGIYWLYYQLICMAKNSEKKETAFKLYKTIYQLQKHFSPHSSVRYKYQELEDWEKNYSKQKYY